MDNIGHLLFVLLELYVALIVIQWIASLAVPTFRTGYIERGPQYQYGGILGVALIILLVLYLLGRLS
jgi:hypothetical protein